MSPSPRQKTAPLVFLGGEDFSSWVFPALFLICFTVYLRTLNPAFGNDDSSETITAGVTLGIQHPPGYPLTALWVRLTSLLPIGGDCFRAGLGSALLSALAVLLLAFNIRRATGIFFPLKGKGSDFLGRTAPLFCAAAGALFLAFSGTFWDKALGAKGGLYVLLLLLLLVFQRCFIGFTADGLKSGGIQRSWFYLAIFLFALGLAHHGLTQILFLPAFVAFAGNSKTSRAFFRRPKAWFRTLAFLILGLSPFLYLPLRSNLHPDLNLGEPATLSLFLAALSRKYYAARESGLVQSFFQILTGEGSWEHLQGLIRDGLELQGRKILNHLTGILGWPAVLLAGWGFFRLRRKVGWKFLSALLLPALFLPLALFAFKADPNFPWLLDNFLIPVDMTLCFLAGLGIYALYLKARDLPFFNSSRRVGGVLVLGAALALSFLNAWSHFSKQDQRGQTFVYDYGVNLMKSCPRNAVLFAETDEDYFPLYYLQGVEGKRPDLKMIPTFLLFETWGVRQIERRYPELGLGVSTPDFSDPFQRIQFATDEIVWKNQDRSPIGFSYFEGAFHRYFLSQHPALWFKTSGAILEMKSPLTKKGPWLEASQLRIRHSESPLNHHPSLEGIRQVYQKRGITLP